MNRTAASKRAGSCWRRRVYSWGMCGIVAANRHGAPCTNAANSSSVIGRTLRCRRRGRSAAPRGGPRPAPRWGRRRRAGRPGPPPTAPRRAGRPRRAACRRRRARHGGARRGRAGRTPSSRPPPGASSWALAAVGEQLGDALADLEAALQVELAEDVQHRQDRRAGPGVQRRLAECGVQLVEQLVCLLPGRGRVLLGHEGSPRAPAPGLFTQPPGHFLFTGPIFPNDKANVLAPIARTRMTEELLGPLAPKLDPRLVAPVAAWLVHEDCPVSGEIYSVGGGRVARFFVGLTEGYANPELTVEDVRDNFDLVRDEAGYTVPVGVAEEIGPLAQRLA